MSSVEKDNLITKINYSERAKAVVSMGVLAPLALAAMALDRGVFPGVPDILKGHIFDYFGGYSFTNYFKLLFGFKHRGLLAGLSFLSNSQAEVYQEKKWQEGVYDEGDFLAYGLGALTWIMADYGAKRLYDSGLTKPLYSFKN